MDRMARSHGHNHVCQKIRTGCASLDVNLECVVGRSGNITVKEFCEEVFAAGAVHFRQFQWKTCLFCKGEDLSLERRSYFNRAVLSAIQYCRPNFVSQTAAINTRQHVLGKFGLDLTS